MHNVEGNLKLGRAVTDPTPSLDVVVDRPDKPEEACGVFAVLASDQPVANLTYFGLYALQHRGQESAGIAVFDNTKRRILTIHMREELLRTLPRYVGVEFAV